MEASAESERIALPDNRDSAGPIRCLPPFAGFFESGEAIGADLLGLSRFDTVVPFPAQSHSALQIILCHRPDSNLDGGFSQRLKPANQFRRYDALDRTPINALQRIHQVGIGIHALKLAGHKQALYRGHLGGKMARYRHSGFV